MKKSILLLAVLFFTTSLFPQHEVVTEVSQIESLSYPLKYKILSGLLVEKVISKNKAVLENTISKEDASTFVAIYYENFPASAELAELTNLGIEYYIESWVPPLKNHPYGFILAKMPTDKFIQTLSLETVRRIATTEQEYMPNNNNGYKSLNADKVWLQGYTGTGVKVAVLDSGLDSYYDGTDMPATYQKKDYWNYPTSTDDDVQNTVSGHGTHVTGSVLGRGTLSNGYNSVNGVGSFKGSAPNADLVFLKIGSDATSGASSNAMIGAVDAAVNIYGADIITMSYGGWYDHHDGSSATEQKFDWAYSQGVTCFVSAGNEGAAARHYSGTVAGSSSTDFIPITISSSRAPVFNLVWNDGIGVRRYLTLKYYNTAQVLIATINYYTTTESTRGVESQYTESQSSLSAGTYYLKVENPSTTSTDFHIYEYWGGGVVKFQSPDPYYTVGQPSTADNVISVGAYVSRTGWYAYNGAGPYSYNGQNSLNQIANFSSRGPRVNGGVMKPNITGPGTAIISLRDMDIFTVPDPVYIDNDGTVGGDINYYVMQGTSMACPLVAGLGALYLHKNPTATPQNVMDALQNNTSKSVTEVYPNSTWGYGKADIYSAMNSTPSIDGYMSESQYLNIARFTSGRDGFGADNTLKSLKYYYDATDIYIGLTGELGSNDNVILFFNFNDYSGRGSNTLGNAGTDAGVFKYIGGAKMDFDVDFALAFNEGTSTTNFYLDACRYGGTPSVIAQGYLGNTSSQLGLSSEFNIGAVFGGTGNITAAYHNGFDSDSLRGMEFKIPIASFAGVSNVQNLSLFAVILSAGGYFSNECIPGDPGATNPENNADFSVLAGGPFHTGSYALPVELTSFTASANGNKIDLKWTTATEVNNYGFEVERSQKTDVGSQMTEWSKIGFVPGSGNSNSFKEYSFSDLYLYLNLNLRYRLKQIDNDGTVSYSEEIEVLNSKPSTYQLSQNFPNPFNPATVISYQLPADSKVSLKVFDILGNEVAVLVQEEKKAGSYEVKFDASRLASGTYIYRIVAGEFVSTKKMVVLK
ncbi:MAG: S8/S53 family peptidase [Ignavibacteriaceae bacterium]